jgi:hypothetical protein
MKAVGSWAVSFCALMHMCLLHHAPPWLYGVSGILPAAQLSKLLPDSMACLLLLL